MATYLHTCYRVGDIDRSVSFYEKLGFQEVARMPIRDEAINVFMGLPGDDPRLELTYNHGVDSYELGTGYNHIAVAVDDLDGTLARLGEQGIEPEKPPYSIREGGSRLCFVRAPAGYGTSPMERGGEQARRYPRPCGTSDGHLRPRQAVPGVRRGPPRGPQHPDRRLRIRRPALRRRGRCGRRHPRRRSHDRGRLLAAPALRGRPRGAVRALPRVRGPRRGRGRARGGSAQCRRRAPLALPRP